MNVTLKDIAKKVGVSDVVVSKVLRNKEGPVRVSEETKKRILEVARELNYRPNNNIGLIVPYVPLDSLFYLRAVTGVHEEAISHGVKIISDFSSKGEIKDIPNIVNERAVGGVILVQSNPYNICKELEEKGIVYVVINPNHDATENCIICDDYGGMMAILTYLYRLGYRRLIMISQENSHPSHKKRKNAYRDFIIKHGLETLIIEGKSNNIIKETQRVVDKKKTNIAFITDTESYANPICVALALNQMSVPEDAGLVTINDVISHSFIPPLTSLRIPVYEMGKLAVQLLLKKWETGSYHYPSETLKPELIVRDSCRDVSKEN